MHFKQPLFFGLVLVAVSGVSTLTLPGGNQLVARDACTDLCNLVINNDAQCKSTSAYDQCFCTAENLANFDGCVSCKLIAAKGRAYSSEALGLDPSTADVDTIERTGEEARARLINECRAAGFPLDGSSGSGSITSTSGTSSGSSAGASSGSSSSSSSSNSGSGASSSSNTFSSSGIGASAPSSAAATATSYGYSGYRASGDAGRKVRGMSGTVLLGLAAIILVL